MWSDLATPGGGNQGPLRSLSCTHETQGAGAFVLSVRFYMDHHVDSAITEGLRRRGVDEDLLVIADWWLQTNREFAGLVYVHQLAITIGQAVRDLMLIAQALDPEDMKNHIEFLPL